MNYGKIFHILETGETVPDSWDQMKTDQNLMMVNLPSTSKEYKDVLAEFTKTLGKIPTIIKVGKFIHFDSKVRGELESVLLQETIPPSFLLPDLNTIPNKCIRENSL